jgi:Mannosyl-glycoprotein endo-beta-N-acetylglucosaminidase
LAHLFGSIRQVRITLAAVAAVGLTSITAQAAAPPIRTAAGNEVPRCVTPDKLMAFLKTRNSNLDPRFRDIARYYKQHGEAWKVRWDYAFFQMAIETNFLTYRAPGGRMGDVDPKQNNFAGIGTTGGGVPGDRYPDVSTGVLAQIQHLVVYAGERIERPVGPRTQLKQNDILALSTPIATRRPLTFQDLAGRWAVDKAYGRSIEWVADRFKAGFCRNGDQAADGDDGSSPTTTAAADPAAAASPAAAAEPLPGRMGMGNVPKLDSKRRAEAARAAGAQLASGTVTTAEPSPGKSGLAGPSKAAATRRPTSDDQGVGIAINTPPLPTGPGAEIARQAIEEQRSTANPERSRLGGLAAPALARTSVSATAPPSAPQGCQVYAASYGGQRTVVVKAMSDGEVRVTLLTVLEGFERSLTDSFLKTQPEGATTLGVFDTREAALKRAETECGTAK